ncbi:helix-turn-helix domain-containing protein [Actinospica robiniae]|uniref:helix-turn-helix domain-containing protein n=1 Tax=Actinospica robiniae TaxID=304901 RepID=UPI00040810B5|nr:helix-turn-helix domain-containing protein [Actinospica robiniae]
MDTLDLLVHPVRLRIVHAMRGDRGLTTARLCELIPNVSKATVYRHVEALVTGGLLEVAEERRVRGAVERVYRLRPERAALDPDAGAGSSPEARKDAYRRAFAIATAVLAAEFDAYLDDADADPVADLVGFRQHAVWLDPDELRALIADLGAVIAPRLGNKPDGSRGRYLLSPIHFPTEPAA